MSSVKFTLVASATLVLFFVATKPRSVPSQDAEQAAEVEIAAMQDESVQVEAIEESIQLEADGAKPQQRSFVAADDEAPVDDVDVSEAPETAAPPTDVPSQAPSTRAPPTRAPATEAPPTTAPDTKAPPTDAPEVAKTALSTNMTTTETLTNDTVIAVVCDMCAEYEERFTQLQCTPERACNADGCVEIESCPTADATAVVVTAARTVRVLQESSNVWKLDVTFIAAVEHAAVEALMDEVAVASKETVEKAVKKVNDTIVVEVAEAEVEVLALFTTTNAPPTEAPPTIAPTNAPATDAPIRIIVNASMVVNTNIKDAAAAQGKGDMLCAAIEENSGIACEYVAACLPAVGCFEAIVPAARAAAALQLERSNYTFMLELSTIQEKEELESYLVNNGDDILFRANLGGTFVSVEVNVTQSFFTTAAPATEAPPTIAPTSVPPTIAPTSSPPTQSPPTSAPETTVPETQAPDTQAPATPAPTAVPLKHSPLTLAFNVDSGRVPDAAALESARDMAVIIEKQSGVTSAAPVSVCSETDCVYAEPAEQTAVARSAGALAVNVWTFVFDVDTEESDDDITQAMLLVGDELASTISADATLYSATMGAGGDDDDDDLSGGAIAGIVVGCIVVVSIIAAIVAYFVLAKNGPSNEQQHNVEHEPIEA
ncbi:hypothetical protein DIPPA_26281 [Diplonema papillatum]|nr:hypothetical protein DIPPA_26281 [Diplonema papillatum]KAJ9453818.1 hypothetical protein DIPPA_26281 [Diplonema papillatum]